MEAYTRWIRRNKEYVHSLESLANGLTWLLPERFSASEIGPEAVTAILGIITGINEHIIDTAPAQGHVGSSVPYSFPYSLCLSVVKDLETLVEVVAEQYYGEKKWNFIAVTEAIKVLIRLTLFRNNGYKMLLSGGEISNMGNEKDLSDLPSSKPIGSQESYSFRNYNAHSPWNPEGRALSALNRLGETARMSSDPAWFRRVEKPQPVVVPQSFVERPTLSKILSEKGLLGALFVMGEVFFITRPLIYVLFIRKYGTRSWVPWCISLAVELLGMGIISQATNSSSENKEKQFQLSSAEKDELKRRKLLWALYLMRDPFFTKHTRQKLERAQNTLGHVPLIGFLTEKIVELLIGAQTRYTYMSGS